MSCVTFSQSEVFILLGVHTSGSQSSNSIGKKQNPGSIWHKTEQEGAHKTDWATGADIFSDFECNQGNQLRGASLARLLLRRERLPTPGQLRAIKSTPFGLFTTGLCSYSQHGLSFLPTGYLLFFKPTARGSACGDGVFLSQSARFFFFFFTVCKLFVAKTHRSLFDWFSIYFILTHKLKKK